MFLEDLRAGLFFEGRKLKYIIHVIEFQWRGHPHAHIVFRLEGDRLAPEEIDRMITSSYTQCKTEEEKELLKLFMTHYCKKGACLKEGKPCSQFFPKQLSPTYHPGNRGYPAYRRLNTYIQISSTCLSSTYSEIHSISCCWPSGRALNCLSCRGNQGVAPLGDRHCES